MAGTSLGIAIMTGIGLRVAGQSTYRPAYYKNGERVSQSLKFAAYLNGQRDRTDRFSFTLWGKGADVGARSLSPGKEFHCFCTPQSFQGRVYDEHGQVMLLPTGEARTTLRTAFVINRIVFGADSDKQIQQEIQAGIRPPHWNTDPGQKEIWRQFLIQKSQKVWDGGPTFEHAKVIVPAGVQLAPADPNAAPGTPVPQVHGQGAPAMVANAVNTMANNIPGAVPGVVTQPNQYGGAPNTFAPPVSNAGNPNAGFVPPATNPNPTPGFVPGGPPATGHPNAMNAGQPGGPMVY